jgi:ribokinase
MALLIVGCTVVDLIFPRVPRLPVWPEHTEFTSRNLTLLKEPPLITIGGNGANAAYVAARCGARVTLHSNAGRDWFGQQARHWLAEAGCEVATPIRAPHTAINVTAADRRLRRATLFYPGETSKAPSSARGFAYVLVCGWPHPPWNVLAGRLRGWHSAGLRTAFDAGPFLGVAPTLTQLKSVLAVLALLLVNEHEILAITRARGLDAALLRLRRVFAGDVIVKRGARGACWLPARTAERREFAGPKVRAYNTVGAGDTFNGALLAALDHGASFPAALNFANRAAASVVRSPRGVLGLRPPTLPNS